MKSADALGLEGLHTDQAPPLVIPASFFLLAPIAMIAAGILLAMHGNAVFASRWLPLAMASTHLGTLGFLGAIMLGALYQMIPVVAGAPVPAVRIAHAVHALFGCGVAGLVYGLATGNTTPLITSAALLVTAFVLFIVPAAMALIRAPTRGYTVAGMRLAMLGLIALATLGVSMALDRSGRLRIHGDWIGWVAAHAGLGAVVWIGGLIVSVSWQVVPMFYLASPPPRWSQIATLASMSIAVIAAPLAAILGGGPLSVSLAVAPAAVMVWLVHPTVTARAIHQRKRKRIDGSVRYWWAGLVCAPLCFVLAIGALFGAHPRWSVALAWTVIWGWSGLIAHGMLTRIVPFLVWFHRYASLVGQVAVPSMRGLLPEARIRVGLVFHVNAVVMGEIALLSGSNALSRAAGTLLAATGAVLLVNLVHVFKQRPAEITPNAAAALSP